MRAYERLLRYVKFDTASDASSQSCPSTKKQLALAKALVEELSGLGLADARVDKFGYVYATLPANCEGQPTIGLIAHMDTVDVVPTTGVCPVLLPYEGGPIALQNGAPGQDADRHQRKHASGRGRQGRHRRDRHRAGNAGA